MAPGKAIPLVHHTCESCPVTQAGRIAMRTPAGDHATPLNMGTVYVTTLLRREQHIRNMDTPAGDNTPTQLRREQRLRNMDTPAGVNTPTQLRRGSPPLRLQRGEPHLCCSGGRYTLLRREESPPQPRCDNHDTPAENLRMQPQLVMPQRQRDGQARIHQRATSLSIQRGPHRTTNDTATTRWQFTRPQNTDKESHVAPGKVRAWSCTTHMKKRAAHAERHTTRALRKTNDDKCLHDLFVTHELENSKDVPLGRLNAAKFSKNLASTTPSICDELIPSKTTKTLSNVKWDD